jgi:hypothetical protein
LLVVQAEFQGDHEMAVQDSMLSASLAKRVEPRPSHSEPLPLPSDRSFGITFAVVFGIATAWALWKGASAWASGFALLGTAFLLLAFTASGALRPLNRLWMRFGAMLHHVVSPVVLGAIYFGMFAPIALVFRLRGRDILMRRFDAAAPTYWTPRDPQGRDPRRSFTKQF